MCRIYKKTKRKRWNDVRFQTFMVNVAEVTVVLVLTVCWIVSLFWCLGGTFAFIFRVTEFGAGGCWSDWGQRQSLSMTDRKSIHLGVTPSLGLRTEVILWMFLLCCLCTSSQSDWEEEMSWLSRRVARIVAN